ncbi:MAG: hypothetical protein ACOX5R_05140 [bacterium]|jgi:hypothetical protein
MKNSILMLLLALLMLNAHAFAQPLYVDLSTLLDADVFLEADGTPIGDPLDEEDSRIDAETLPENYQDGSPVTTQDGRTSFLFAPLKQSGLDAAALSGQTVDVEDGNYQYLDLALLAAPGAFNDPFPTIDFLYADGTSQSERLGPVAGWFQSPTAYDNIFYSYTDDSGVNSIISLDTFTDEELFYVTQESGNGNDNGNRFVDGNGYVLYWFDDMQGLQEANLGVTVGNNFVISIATEYYDPEFSTTEGYEVLANSMEIHDGVEHMALGNLREYTFDLAPYLARGTNEIYLLFTDATTENGWGPYITDIRIYTGEARSFEQTLAPDIDTSQAEVYAMFQTNGGEEEQPYLYDNRGSGPSSRQHRFADGSGSITYRFDLPDDVDDARLMVDMANNFVVSLAGQTDEVRYASVNPASAEESEYLIDAGNSNTGNNHRFADGSNYMIYQFDLPDDITTAVAQIDVGNQFVIEIASGTDGEFQLEMDWVAENGGTDIRDNSNRDFYNFDLTPYLQNNPGKIVRIRLSDGIPENGWGADLYGIAIYNQLLEDGEDAYEEVLNSMDLFGEDIHNEYNKGYYEIDLASVLQDNPEKEVFIRFTDQSTNDGWGPGIFWMAVYSGELEILSDRYVFENLKTTSGNPVNHGVNLLHRRYTLDAQKTLNQITLPEAEGVYLLAATLNAGDTAVSDWMLR